MAQLFHATGKLQKEWCTTALFGCVVMAYFAVSVLAGKDTNADISAVVGFATESGKSGAWQWLVGVIGVMYGLLQRKLRKDTVEKLQARITKLETELDPSRSSSGLTIRGDTHPEDKR